MHALANQDIHSVINHYIDLQAAKAGTEFLVALEKAYKFISRFPDAGSKRLGTSMKLPELRTWSLTKFPYSLIYISNAQGVDIFRLLHHKRDMPNYSNIYKVRIKHPQAPVDSGPGHNLKLKKPPSGGFFIRPQLHCCYESAQEKSLGVLLWRPYSS